MICKTIILSNTENLTTNAPKGILTLSKDEHSINGKIRLYNLTTLPSGTKIGLYINDNVLISPLTFKHNYYMFDLQSNIDINQSIYCALIDTNNNKKVLLEGGSSNSFSFTDSPFDAVLEAKDEQLEQTITNAINNANIDNCENCNCANCEYKQYFYEHYSSQTPNSSININEPVIEECIQTFNPAIQSKVPENLFDESVQSNIIEKLQNEVEQSFKQFANNFNTSHNLANDDINLQNLNNSIQNNSIKSNKKDSSNNDEQEKLDFLDDIIYQIDEILSQNPIDDVLNSIIPNSKFVKVENESPYVLGVIYENKILKYIAYGVPATYNELPPRDLGQHYQWLPLNPRDVMSDGYFMIFQDALNGNLVEINFEE